MEPLSNPTTKKWTEKLENLFKNKDGVEKRLNGKNLSIEKRESLEWHLKDVERAIARHYQQAPQP